MLAIQDIAILFLNCAVFPRDYHFRKSEIPYTDIRSREECLQFMHADIEKFGNFVLSAVTGDLGEQITSMYTLAVWITAPLDVRVKRVEQRTFAQHGNRVCVGGDMFEQRREFVNFVASRTLVPIEEWAQTLTCPILRVDGTKDIGENVRLIAKHCPIH